MYGLKCLEYLKLQKSYDELSDKYDKAMGQLDTAALLNKNLETLNDMKDMEIQDLRTALAFQSLPDPDINSLVHIMSDPDTNLKKVLMKMSLTTVIKSTLAIFLHHNFVCIAKNQSKLSLIIMCCVPCGPWLIRCTLMFANHMKGSTLTEYVTPFTLVKSTKAQLLG